MYSMEGMAKFYKDGFMQTVPSMYIIFLPHSTHITEGTVFRKHTVTVLCIYTVLQRLAVFAYQYYIPSPGTYKCAQQKYS